MIKNDALTVVYDHLLHRNLGEAIIALEAFLAVHPHQINSDRLHAIRTDLQLMTDYWQHGFKDPQLDSLYNNLLRRMYMLYANIASNYNIRHTPYLSSMLFKVHASLRDWSPLAIKEELESFVSDVAMLELEPSHTAESKQKELYAKHQQQMADLFYYILTSDLWSDTFAAGIEDILLSPTIDTVDQQQILSSVMLSTMTFFDIAKFRTLVHVYQRATDDRVQQRALVGWALSLNADIAHSIYPEEEEHVKQLLEDEHCCEELAELQRQLIYCVTAEQDNMTIQREIIPNLSPTTSKNSDSPITIKLIDEEDLESQLDDILHPNEAEEKLEKMESSFMRMINMQKQGSDIYFSGFAQMKRYPFFNELVNWFVPFYFEHPEMSEIYDKYKHNMLLKSMLGTGPFCNSDKYSFMLAFEQVMASIPKSVRKLLDRRDNKLFPLDQFVNKDFDKPTYLRRIYLQDLYRFFRLNAQHEAFKNVFNPEERDYLLFANDMFSDTPLQRYYNEITAFLLKKKRRKDAKRVMKYVDVDKRDFQYYMMQGYLNPYNLDYFMKAVELESENERALAGYARALYSNEEYEKSLEVYEKLLKIQPEKKSYLLYKAVCQIELHQYEEAEKMLFKLNYEEPDDVNVARSLAWVLTCNGKYEQAERLYSQLLAKEKVENEDLLNFGYCLWFSGKIDEAANCFRRYLKETGEEKGYIIDNEAKLLSEKGISEAETLMMLYIL